MESKQSEIKIYKVGDTYYRLDTLQSVSELCVCDNRATGYINGNEVGWTIMYKHYKPHLREGIIKEDETHKEYQTLLKAFKEQ